MSPEELLARLNEIITSPLPEHQNIDLNQTLPNGRTVIDEFVQTQNSHSISTLLSQIGDKCRDHKNITIDFQRLNPEGHTLFKSVMDKVKWDWIAGNTISALKAINEESTNNIDFNAKVFSNGNTLPLELCRIGNDPSVENAIIQFDRRSGLPLFDVNAVNDGNSRIIDYYKERIDNENPSPEIEGLGPAPAFNLDNMLRIVRSLRVAGSVEPTDPFVPKVRKLDMQNVHNKMNEEIVHSTLDRLHHAYPQLNIDSEIADLKQSIKEYEGLPPSSIESATKKLEEYEQNAHDTQDHNIVWNFKKELAYLWCEAKVVGNKAGVIGTLSDTEGMQGCPWGQLVNLCNTAQGGDTIDLNDVGKRSNQAVVKRILEQHRQEFGNVDTTGALDELTKYIERNVADTDVKQDAIRNLSRLKRIGQMSQNDITWDFADDMAKLWQKCKTNERQLEFIDSISGELDQDAYAQLLKIASVVELPRKSQRKDVLDFDKIFVDAELQNEICDKVYNKLRARIQDGNSLEKAVQKWVDDVNNKSYGLEKQIVDGAFNEVFLDMVRKKNENEVLYSRDFKEWSNITEGIAVTLEFSDNKLANIPKSLDTEKFINNANSETFVESLRSYNQKHGVLDLKQNGPDGRPLVWGVLDRIRGEFTPQTAAVIRDLTDSSKVKVDWLAGDHAMMDPGPLTHAPLQGLYDAYPHHMQDDLMPLILRSVTAPGVNRSNIRLNLSNPDHERILQLALNGEFSIDDYIKSQEATKFIRDLDIHNPQKAMDEHQGQLDLTQKGLDGRPIFFTLMDKGAAVRDVENIVKILSDPRVKMDWGIENPHGLIDGVLPHGSLSQNALQVLHDRCSWHPDQKVKKDIENIIVNSLEDPAFNKKNMNLYHYPEISQWLATKSEMPIKEYRDLISATRLLDNIQHPSFVQDLEKHPGVLDLSKPGLDGRPMIFGVIENYSTKHEFDDILQSYLLNYNEKIRVDWLAKDATEQSALEKLYITINNQETNNAPFDVAQSNAVNAAATVLLSQDINHGELQQFWNTVGNTNSQHLLQLEACGAPLSIEDVHRSISPVENVLASKDMADIMNTLKSNRRRAQSDSSMNRPQQNKERRNSLPLHD